MQRLTASLALILSLLLSIRALAVFEAEMPLAQLVKDSHVIALVKVEKLNRERGTAILTVEKVVHGDEPLSRIPVRLIADKGSEGNPQDMLIRLDDGMSLVVFLSHLSPGEHQLFAYGHGSWFKLRGTGERDSVIGQFQQGEPYLRKTYHGDVEELVRLIAEKAELPPIDKQAKPSLGAILFGAAQPSPAVETTNEIELGPAWTTAAEPPKKTGDSTPGYLIGSLLALAAIGLVVMLTRSLPEVGK
jgi:hypothetical protein